MYLSPDFSTSSSSDRQQDRRAAAAARSSRVEPARAHLARTLRRTADRLDAATAAPSSIRGTHPGRGLPTSGVSGVLRKASISALARAEPATSATPC